jgi:outer membrane immunogenic protein
LKRLLISAATVALMSTAALAADLPIIEEAPVVEAAPVVYDWSGFYIGINGGYAWGDTEVDFNYTSGPPGTFFTGCLATGACLGALDYETDGFLIGGHAGFNWQSGAFVFGLEADIDYSDMEGDAGVLVLVPGAVGVTTAASTEYDYFGTFRGRIGAAFHRVLVYGTGGLAFAGVENFATSFESGAGGRAFEGSNDDTQVGWTAGGGVEFAVTDNVTLGAEAPLLRPGRRGCPAEPGHRRCSGRHVHRHQFREHRRARSWPRQCEVRQPLRRLIEPSTSNVNARASRAFCFVAVALAPRWTTRASDMPALPAILAARYPG